MKHSKTILCLAIALIVVLMLEIRDTNKPHEINAKLEGDPAAIQAVLGGSSAQQPAAAPAVTQPAAPQTTTPAATQPSGDNTDKPAGDNGDKPAAPAELSSSSSLEEVVAKYAEVYEKTKATGTFLGKSKTTCTAIAIDGKSNGAVKAIADAAIGSEGDGTTPLSPSRDDNPGLECAVKASDIESYSYTDNGDGTATIRLDVKPTQNSRRFQDPAGDMLDVMEDLKGTLASVSALSWSEGDADSNVVLTSKGYCEVTYDKSTDMMTKAIYVLYTDADVQHANVLFFKNKNATASFEYTVTYPGQ